MPKKDTQAPKKTTEQGKAPAKAPAKKDTSKDNKVAEHPLFEKRERQWSAASTIGKKMNLTRMVRWPHYVKLQRQRKILMTRLKIPPAIHQFSRTLDKATAVQLFKLLAKYRPETPQEKSQRLKKIADAKTKDPKAPEPKKPNLLKYGINNVTTLIEKKKAKLVIIAHDVDPIEIVVWLPALCRKMDVPYAIVKSKSRLGALVHQKTATAVALTEVNKEDVNELTNLANTFQESFNKNADLRKQWGGGILSNRSMQAIRKKEAAVAKESAAKSKA